LIQADASGAVGGGAGSEVKRFDAPMVLLLDTHLCMGETTL